MLENSPEKLWKDIETAGGMKSYISSKVQEQTPIIDVDDLNPKAYSPSQNSMWDGEKFPGGYGITQLLDTDYWTLRKRSEEVFKKNLYGRGIIRRLVTNEINIGLSLEVTPDESIIGVPEDSLDDWSETQELRFGIYGKNPMVCDYLQNKTFGALQREARREALVCGDILVVLRQSRVTKLPMIQYVAGDSVRTPTIGDIRDLRKGNYIKHGVEFNKKGRVDAHWVQQEDLSFKRIPAYGSKTGRKISWLLYGTDKRMDDVRGEPLLSIVLQSLQEIDKYRDSAQRQALVNSFWAMFVTKDVAAPGSNFATQGAVRKDEIQTTNSDGTTNISKMAKMIPGLIAENMQVGEKIDMKGGAGTDINFDTFEGAVIRAVSWAMEIPPEILILGFTNNYSASQAALNEFKIYLSLKAMEFGEQFCTPIRIEYMISEALLGSIKTPANYVSSFLESWRDLRKYDVYGAWISMDWFGAVKPSTDMLKQVKASKAAVEEGYSTHSKEARALNGTKWTKNMNRVAKENKIKADAMRPLLELQKEFGPDEVTKAVQALNSATYDLGQLTEVLEDAS